MIYLFLAEGFEEIEALTPVDILRRAKKAVKTVGVTGKTVCGSHGIPVVCDITIEELTIGDDTEMLILPGGSTGTVNLGNCAELRDILLCAANDGIYIAAICAAPSVLGGLGLLKGRKAVCYPGFEKYLEGAELSSQRVCVSGKFITGIGMGASTEFSLKLVELLCSKDDAERIAQGIIC